MSHQRMFGQSAHYHTWPYISPLPPHAHRAPVDAGKPSWHCGALIAYVPHVAEERVLLSHPGGWCASLALGTPPPLLALLVCVSWLGERREGREGPPASCYPRASS